MCWVGSHLFLPSIWFVILTSFFFKVENDTIRALRRTQDDGVKEEVFNIKRWVIKQNKKKKNGQEPKLYGVKPPAFAGEGKCYDHGEKAQGSNEQ